MRTTYEMVHVCGAMQCVCHYCTFKMPLGIMQFSNWIWMTNPKVWTESFIKSQNLIHRIALLYIRKAYSDTPGNDYQPVWQAWQTLALKKRKQKPTQKFWSNTCTYDCMHAMAYWYRVESRITSKCKRLNTV